MAIYTLAMSPFPPTPRKLLLWCYVGKMPQAGTVSVLAPSKLVACVGKGVTAGPTSICLRKTVLRSDVGRKSRAAVQVTSRVARNNTALCSRSSKHCSKQKLNNAALMQL